MTELGTPGNEGDELVDDFEVFLRAIFDSKYV
jgi:hypothetical protein